MIYIPFLFAFAAMAVIGLASRFVGDGW